MDFLAPLPDLMADQERRAREPKREPIPPPGKDKDKRIAALIRDLEDTAARQDGQPGGVDLAGDPVVSALIQEGGDAVEPLLKCLEDDTRLTRSVHFHRDFFTHRSLIGVHEAAYVALSGILQTSFFGVASTGDDLSGRGAGGRRATAAALPAVWSKFKGVPLEERWFKVLADDTASPDEWLQAAGNIVQPVDVSVSPSSMIGGWVTVPNRAPGEKPKLRGEALRAKKDPSVAELMGKRMETVRSSGEPGSRAVWSIGKACTLANDLYHWDENAAVPYLRRMVQVCRDYLAGNDAGSSRASAVGELGREIARLTRLRVQAGDAAGLDAYAAWIAGVRPDTEQFSSKELLRPMWENPDQPAVAAAVESMFTDENSPWLRKFLRASNTHDLAETPLLGVDGFRKRLLVELTDIEKAGSIKIRQDGGELVQVDGAWSGAEGVGPEGDPLSPEPGTESPFRVCDYYAWLLSRVNGMPCCQPYWPEARRDKAVAACAAVLRHYGERYRYSEAQRSLWNWPDDDKARITFSALDHPATADEVKKGLAIFSLEGEGETRSAKLAARPMKARCTTLKDSPYGTSRYDPKTKKTETTITYDQDGLVWQAEEVLKEGKWERYYGFVGANRIARVPAAEIEFPPAEPRR